MQVPITLRFARTAQVLAEEARRLGLTVPSFRSPPRLHGAHRSIRRAPWGAVVAVRLRERPFATVVDDMVEGVVAANRLSGARAAAVRARLAAAAGPLDDGGEAEAPAA